MSATGTQNAIESRLKMSFRTGITIPAETERTLSAALGETLARTGNFIRAELAYNVGRAYRLSELDAERLAIAMEYFHTASLVFDDLPSMDDATHRRGAVCVHHLHGEGSAILAALALINRAYALLWQAIVSAPAPEQHAALGYVERYLGLGGLLNGQAHDIHYARLAEPERDPQAIAVGKTVALIRLSLVLPAIVGGAAARAVQLFDRLAIFWGLAYQVLDDLKDVLDETSDSGKTNARDSLLDRPNMALKLGYAATVRRLERLVALAQRTVAQLQLENAALACLDRVHERFEAELADLVREPHRLPVAS